MAQYQQHSDTLVLRVSPKRKWINKGDVEWDDFAAWITAGNTPLPSDRAADLPAVVQLAFDDRDMARIGEDLIDALIARGVLAMSDFPQVVQDRIARRKNLRTKLRTEMAP